jgi:hypothetical protein
LQASQVYGGWSGRHLVSRIIREMETRLAAASRLAPGIKDARVLAGRLEVLSTVLRNARNAVSYQAQLDRARQLGLKPDPNPVAGTQSGWDRQLLMETARAEIDNTALLMKLLEGTSVPVLDLAASTEEEDIRVLGPDLIEQLQKKINIMNSHWEDYKRIFTTPNL